jgi:hypothetical protein
MNPSQAIQGIIPLCVRWSEATYRLSTVLHWQDKRSAILRMFLCEVGNQAYGKRL